jgi:hypothetical protein
MIKELAGVALTCDALRGQNHPRLAGGIKALI